MIEFGKSRIWTPVKEYVLMTVGMFCYAFGWIGCILPAKCMGGGASGLSLLIYYATGETITIGVMVFIINAILLLIAGFIVGWKFGIKTIFCVCMLSFAMSTMQELFTQPDGTILDIFQLDNRLLSTILGGIFSGVGVTMSFAQGGSTGGVDIVAMIINKYRTVSYGKIVRSIDSVIIAADLLCYRWLNQHRCYGVYYQRHTTDYRRLYCGLEVWYKDHFLRMYAIFRDVYYAGALYPGRWYHYGYL